MSLVAVSIDSEECPHTGAFDESDHGCRKCHLAKECQWLEQDALGTIADKADDELIESLQFARNYVGTFTRLAKHNMTVCKCKACRWLRQTERLLENLDN